MSSQTSGPRARPASKSAAIDGHLLRSDDRQRGGRVATRTVEKPSTYDPNGPGRLSPVPVSHLCAHLTLAACRSYHNNHYSGYYRGGTSMAVDLLQRVGLNKYEAVAYLALLTDGPLTGY